MPLQISSLSADFKTRASSPYLVFECEGVRAQTKATKNATTWDEIIILPGHFRDGCELVVAAYNHNAIMADDLIGSGGCDLKGLHGAGAAGGKMRRIQLFDKNDEPAGSLMLDVVSVEKEGMAGAAAAPAAGAPVGTGAGLGAGGTAASGVGGAAAAAPTTPGAVGEVRRTPSGPSAVEAERERAQHARETTTTPAAGGAAPEGEGIIEKIKRATGVGAPREPSPERRATMAPSGGVTTAAAAPAVPVSATRPVPAPRHRELEGERRAAAATTSATSELESRMSQFGRVIEGPEGGQVVERKVLTRMGERVAEIERVQVVTTRTPVESNFVVEVRLLSQRELPQEARREEGNITERVIRVQEPEAPEAVAPSLKFEGEARGMRQQAAAQHTEVGGGTGGTGGMGGAGGGTMTSGLGGGGGAGGGVGGGGGGSTMAERYREGQARGGTGEGLMEAAGLRGGETRSSTTASGMGGGGMGGGMGGMGGGGALGQQQQGQGKLASQARGEEERLLGSTRAEV